jgi:uncharacterized surface protein with fasciclin (FAS1) repeats
MKGVQAILPFAALASAFVIPEDAVMNQVNLERDSRDSRDSHDIFDKLASPQELLHGARDKFANVVEASHNAFDDVVYSITDTFESAANGVEDAAADVFGGGDHHPHDPDHKEPYIPHDPHDANLTLYQLITQSKYTTKFAELVNQFDEAIEALNKTSANVTVFVPTDKAFEKIPDHGHKPSKEMLAKVLMYHSLPHVYTAGSVLGAHTLPTILNGTGLSDKPDETPYRVSVKLGLTGLFINSYARVIYPNVFGTNGVIHAIDHILIPPPHSEDIVKYAPQAFSTFLLALLRTEFRVGEHQGITLFAPPNFAWAKLGARVNAFLFSDYGTKYLKAILQYHVVANQTLFSDAYYGPKDDSKSSDIPKGLFHVSCLSTPALFINLLIDSRSSFLPCSRASRSPLMSLVTAASSR